MKINLYSTRKEYKKAKFSLKDSHANPLMQFQLWLNEAIHAKVKEPTAMNIATVDKDGAPSSRIVLLKEVNDKGFVFFTNYTSRKGQAIAHDKRVALNFFWPELERQIRIEGKAYRLPAWQSDRYFASRPFKSQIGAWVSRQSKPLKNRRQLIKIYIWLRLRHLCKIKRPPFWGGYIVVPECLEFWQGRASRLHDRIIYRRKEESFWQRGYLNP